jgi:RES domain-containing protein/LysM repeat protein
LGTDALVAGALSSYDKNAAKSYFENSIGQEAGQFIGQNIARPLRTYFDNLTADTAQPKAANQPPVGTSTSSAESTAMVGVTQNPSNAAPVYDQSQGVVADQNGNPVGPTATPATAAPAEPLQEITVTAQKDPVTYTVAQGDSYARIAREQYGDERYAALVMQANGIDPTYGNVHGLQIGAELTLPDLSTLGTGDLASARRQGGTLLGADQAVTDQLAAEKSKVDTVQAEQGDAGVGIDPRTGLRAGPTIENAAALGLNSTSSFSGGGGQSRGAGATGTWEEPTMLDRVAQWASDVHLGTRALGLLQAVGGVGEAALGGTLVAGGAATSEVGVGIPIAAGGYGLALLGADQTSTGFRRMWTGEYQPSMVETVARAAGASPQQAALIDATLNIAAPIKGAAVIQEMRAIAPYAAGVSVATDQAALRSADGAVGVTYEGPLYRAVPAGGDALDISYSVSANGRYTAPGQGGLYFASNAGTVEAEFVNNGSSLVGRDVNVFPNSSVNNLLDLTDPAVREGLGVSLQDLTRTGGTSAWRYEVTQPLGAYAQAKGFNGIIAPSAQADGGVNLILFGAKGVR